MKLSDLSISRRKQVHPDLLKVLDFALDNDLFVYRGFPFHVAILEGLRSPERHARLYAQGRTTPGPKVTWTKNSKHCPQADGYSHAIDIVPLPLNWSNDPENLARYDAMAFAMFRAASVVGVRLRWGADWDGDGKFREKGESDSPHFEIVF